MPVEGRGETAQELSQGKEAMTCLDFANEIEPTAIWSQPCAEPAPAKTDFDIGRCCMHENPYLLLPCSDLRANLFVSSIPDPERLWALRHQYFTANDRLRLQTQQQQLPGLMTKFDFICMRALGLRLLCLIRWLPLHESPTKISRVKDEQKTSENHC
jgi:hypothetical protein